MLFNLHVGGQSEKWEWESCFPCWKQVKVFVKINAFIHTLLIKAVATLLCGAVGISLFYDVTSPFMIAADDCKMVSLDEREALVYDFKVWHQNIKSVHEVFWWHTGTYMPESDNLTRQMVCYTEQFCLEKDSLEKDGHFQTTLTRWLDEPFVTSNTG